ncbi:hypothetical protein YC2023_065499 [Brassica napus]
MLFSTVSRKQENQKVHYLKTLCSHNSAAFDLRSNNFQGPFPHWTTKTQWHWRIKASCSSEMTTVFIVAGVGEISSAARRERDHRDFES